uniref:Transcription factor protein n=1 Tax=Ciona intestinalis TaxID=7719 RepID=H2XXU6_CIOIN
MASATANIRDTMRFKERGKCQQNFNRMGIVDLSVGKYGLKIANQSPELNGKVFTDQVPNCEERQSSGRKNSLKFGIDAILGSKEESEKKIERNPRQQKSPPTLADVARISGTPSDIENREGRAFNLVNLFAQQCHQNLNRLNKRNEVLKRPQFHPYAEGLQDINLARHALDSLSNGKPAMPFETNPVVETKRSLDSLRVQSNLCTSGADRTRPYCISQAKHAAAEHRASQNPRQGNANRNPAEAVGSLRSDGDVSNRAQKFLPITNKHDSNYKHSDNPREFLPPAYAIYEQGLKERSSPDSDDVFHEEPSHPSYPSSSTKPYFPRHYSLHSEPMTSPERISPPQQTEGRTTHQLSHFAQASVGNPQNETQKMNFQHGLPLATFQAWQALAYHPALRNILPTAYPYDSRSAAAMALALRPSLKSASSLGPFRENSATFHHQRGRAFSSNAAMPPQLYNDSRGAPKKRRKWSRAVFSLMQRRGLEKSFQVQKYVAKPERRGLAEALGLTDAQVKIWFQNRRMKWRQELKGRNESNPCSPTEKVPSSSPTLPRLNSE